MKKAYGVISDAETDPATDQSQQLATLRSPMSWSRQKSLARIRHFKGTVPQGLVNVRTFSTTDMVRRRSEIASLHAKGGAREDLIFSVQPSEAVIVEGVHVYVQLLDFATVMLDQERETEASHARALSMLHLHYSGCDRVAEEYEAQRVDYHGARMHAVIVSPAGPDKAKERAVRALEFADALKRTIEETSRSVGGGLYRTRVRIGMDAGTAVAVNSGRSNEPEPLFLGNPANYAAKLAEGDVEGIYPSDQVRRDLGVGAVGGLVNERMHSFSYGAVPILGLSGSSRASDEAVARFAEAVEKGMAVKEGSLPAFTFHRHTPPLRTIDFKELSPSNSVRMELTSIFADIAGFTNYVNDCIRTGRVAEMVANLHVIRNELAATLKEDFSGRKVRFIGDCVHGLLAEGTRDNTEASATVTAAVEAAAGMRSSFELCQDELPNVSELGLAIGIEYGTTPITRLGIRGDKSVRCSVSKAISASEALQSTCEGDETALGPRALNSAPAGIKRLFVDDGKAHGLDYDAVTAHLAAPLVVKSGELAVEAKAYAR